MDTPLTAVESLARSAVAGYREELPRPAMRAATRAFVDWAGVTSGGASGVMARALAASAADGGGPCRLIGSGRRASPHTAALINGTAAHTLELDDIYAPGTFHPGAPVIAAALAVAEMSHASGARLLKAIIIGYEVGGRVATDLGPAHYRLFHTTGTAGALGAAAACACILRLDEIQTAAALSISATLGAGLQQTFRSSAAAKPLHAGHAAEVGVVAALAARHGGSGALDVLDGAVGMGVAMSEAPVWTASREPFGPAYLIEQTTTKAYPCCGHTFAPIDAARQIRETGMRIGDIAEVHVQTYSAALDVAGISRPRTPEEAKFSIPFVIAVMLLDGAVGLDTFAPQTVADARIRDLMTRVRLESRDEFTGPFPAKRGARVSALCQDGRKVTVTVPDRFGSPANPMSASQLDAKFAALVPARADQPVESVLAELLGLECVADVCELTL